MSKDFSDRSAVELAALLQNNSTQMECQICLAFLLEFEVKAGTPNRPTDTQLVIHRDYSHEFGKIVASGGCGNFFHRGCLNMVVSQGQKCPKCSRDVKNIALCPAVIQGTVEAMDVWSSAAVAMTRQLTLLQDGLRATCADRDAVQRENQRLQCEAAALRRGIPNPDGQMVLSVDAGTSMDARVSADSSTSTQKVATVTVATSTDGLTGFLLRKPLLRSLFRQGVEHLLGIEPVGTGHRRMMCSFVEAFHLLEQLDARVFKRAGVVNVDMVGRTLHKVMVEQRWPMEKVNRFAKFLAFFGARPALVASFALPPDCVRPAHLFTSSGIDSVELKQAMLYVEAILQPFFHTDGGSLEVIKALMVGLGTPFLIKLIVPPNGGALGSEFISRKVLDSLRITLRTEKERNPVTRLLPSPLPMSCFMCPETAPTIPWKDYNAHLVNAHDVDVVTDSPRCVRCELLLKDRGFDARIWHDCYCPRRQAPLLASPTYSLGRKVPELLGVRVSEPDFPVVVGEVDITVFTVNDEFVEISFRSF